MSIKSLLIASSAVLLFACGSSGDDPTEVTELITTSEGGTLDLGEATVEIPANALSEDTEITLSFGSVADFGPLENARSVVVVFDPPSTLSEMAQITIDPGTPAATPNQYAILYQYGDGEWIGVDASTIINADGMVKVAARDIENGVESNVRLDISGGMSHEEIDIAAEEAKQINVGSGF